MFHLARRLSIGTGKLGAGGNFVLVRMQNSMLFVRKSVGFGWVSGGGGVRGEVTLKRQRSRDRRKNYARQPF